MQRIGIDQLIAFNDEVRALARAGIPFDAGLRAAAAELPRRLSGLARTVGQQLEEGASLAEVMQRHGDVFPPAYRAVVAAGLGSGRLPAALEQLAVCLRRLRDLRETVSRSLIYPLIVAASAYALFIASLFYLVPTLTDAYRELLGPSQGYEDLLSALRASVYLWGPLVPLLAAVVLVVLGRWTRRTSMAWSGLPLPSLVRLREESHLAVFLELLAMLIQYERPIPEAVALAGEASGSSRLKREAEQIASQLRSGQAEIALDQYRAIPPLLVWQLAQPRGAPGLERALRRMADVYRRRAERRAGVLSFYYPLLASAMIGGLAVIAYAVWVFAPWCYLLLRLSRPV